MAAKYQVRPELLAALIQAESGGNPNAVSNKGARGLAQVMPSTGLNPGFGVQPLRDNSPDEQKRFANDYLGAMLDRYDGDETKALAAYNAGPGAVDKAGGVPQYKETQNYVQKIGAMLNPISSASASEEPWQPEQPLSLEEFVAQRRQQQQPQQPSEAPLSLEEFVAQRRQQQPQQAQQLEEPSFRVGMGKGMYDAVQGIGGLIGYSDPLNLGDTSQADKAISNSTAGSIGELGGNLAAYAPTMLIPGANTAMGAALIGAGSGAALTPGDAMDRLTGGAAGGAGGLAGAAIGKAIPYVGKLGNRLVAPFGGVKGKEQILARMLKSAVGDNAGDVAARLDNAQSLVPGSLPTAAEAAVDSGGLSAIQRFAEQANPENYQFRRTLNANARSAAINRVAGTESDMADAIARRQQFAGPLYEQAKAQTVPVDDVLRELLQRPSMGKALSEAKQIAAEMGTPIDPAMEAAILSGNGQGAISGEALHWLKMGMDKLAKDPKNPLDSASQRAINGTIKEFEGWREGAIPAYAKAQKIYRGMSKPINQMEIGQELYNKARPALTDHGTLTRETANSYAKALRDSNLTAKRATGQRGATIENTLTRKQLNTVNSVAQDMARKASADEAGRGIGSNTFQNFAMQDIGAAAGMPGLLLNALTSKIPVAGGLLKSMAQGSIAGSELEMKNMLSDALLDPKKTAALLRMADQQGLLQQLFNNQRLQTIPGIMGAGGSAYALEQ